MVSEEESQVTRRNVNNKKEKEQQQQHKKKEHKDNRNSSNDNKEEKNRDKEQKDSKKADDLSTETGKKVEKVKSKYGPLPKALSKERMLSRGIFIFGIILYVWYTNRGVKETHLARQKDVITQRGINVDCNEEYADEISQFPGCTPRKCGRYVSDKIVTNFEAETLLKLAKKGLSLGGSEGGASILDLHSGALSYGKRFVNIYTMQEAKSLFSPADLNIYKIVKEKIKKAIAETFQMDVDSLYLTHPTFFSKLNNKKPATDHDEYWHVHVDKITYESFHYTSLLYLSDFNLDFKGGRLVFIDGDLDKPRGNVTIEPRKGRVAMFTSGEENTHFVERVTEGERYAITVSFTCDISKSISDPNGVQERTGTGRGGQRTSRGDREEPTNQQQQQQQRRI